MSARDVVAGQVDNPRAVELRTALADLGTAAGQGGGSDSKTRSGDSDMQPTQRADVPAPAGGPADK